jgi:ribosomal protein S18 acetylase RimI-like enzyme
MTAMPAEILAAIDFRRGSASDEQWLFQLFRITMQHHIDAAWGWEELLQHEGFVTSLPARGFQILELSGVTIGSYHLSSKPARHPDTLELDMIMVEPTFQGQGFGGLMMGHIQNAGREAGLPVQLNVLKTNPAVSFHRRYGFTDKSSDQHSLVMIWSP